MKASSATNILLIAFIGMFYVVDNSVGHHIHGNYRIPYVFGLVIVFFPGAWLIREDGERLFKRLGMK